MARAKGEPKKGAISVREKGIHIGEKRARDETQEGPIVKAPAKPKATSVRAATQDAQTSAAPGEGTSANPGILLGLEASAMDNPAMAEKLLQGFILPADKETVSRLDHKIPQLPQLGDYFLPNYGHTFVFLVF